MKAAHAKSIRLLVLLTVIVMSLGALTQVAEAGDFIVQDDLIELSNPYYELALNVADGGIAYILDKSTNQRIGEGGKNNALWIAALDSGSPISSSAYPDQFSYAWNAAQSTLTLTYTGSLAVTVTIQIADGPWLKMQAVISNHSGANIRFVNFPGELKILESDIHDALLPMIPGAQISSAFFAKRGTFVNQYPGAMFADYLAVRSARGKITLYTARGAVLQPALIGFEHVAETGYTKMMHNYKTWIADAQTWTSPQVVVHIGQDYPETIASYRIDNHIDDFKALVEKLGSLAPTYFSAPMYKLDLAALGKPFRDLPSAVIDKMNFPGLVHFVAFQSGGHDRSYPDFIPPDKKWGSTADFASLVSYLQSRGSLAVPYTNFSWWDAKGPTMLNLPPDTTLDKIVVKGENGLPIFETYGPRTGFVASLQNAFVKDRIAEQHKALMQTVGVNGIFEDQWGARNAPYDFNGAGPNDPATAYFEGVLAHYRTYAADALMTESGVDVLADQGVGFMGTNYLWDLLGYRAATAPVTTYYPMAGMLLRDKVLLYQHDLAAQTWTDSKDMLRWNLAQGYNLSIAFFDEALPGLNMDNPWLNLVGVFQKYALANYADQRIVSYDDLGNGVTRTAFITYQVYANWSQDSAYTLNGNTLPPGGVLTQANDHTVTAGVFTAYNGNPLSSGEHSLVETRSPDGLKIFQPIGPDTMIHINKDAAWTDVTVVAHRYDGTVIASVDAVISGSDVSFSYAARLNGQTVGYYQLTAR
jgi:hypothetical protein